MAQPLGRNPIQDARFTVAGSIPAFLCRAAALLEFKFKEPGSQWINQDTGNTLLAYN
jgi:hypothetical protein